MNYAAGKSKVLRKKILSKALTIQMQLNPVQKIFIGLALAAIFIVALSSFTLINKEAEPTESHEYGNKIEVTETVNLEEIYAIKIFRYFEIFPHMRSYLYHFTHTDYKKICDNNTMQPQLDINTILLIENTGNDMRLSEKNNLPVFGSSRMIAPGIYLLQAKSPEKESSEKDAMQKGS
jgi:hypothetical protein